MYPNLYFAFKDLFGVEFNFLKFVNSFGFFVAIAFISAAYVLTRELKRKGKEGVLKPMEEKIMVGKPASLGELAINFVIGFLFGYKIGGALILGSAATENPQDFLFSSQGSVLPGLILGGLLAYLKFAEKNKQKLAKPEMRTVRMWPHDRVGDLVIYAALFGFAGAKVFHNLENWDQFIENPLESLFSPSGLTFYGGLICAAIAIWYYAKRKNIPIWHLNDAAAPALILAYAVGRIGCQVAGDGDWGIVNNAPNPFSWLPDWMWSYNYPNNVNEEGVPIPGCVGPFCNQLPDRHYPTPFYETIMGLMIFGVLMGLRKRLKVPGTLFAVYLVLNGLERFLIEKIRVNTTYDNLPFQPTQAELISSGMMIGGIVLFFWLKRKSTALPHG